MSSVSLVLVFVRKEKKLVRATIKGPDILEPHFMGLLSEWKKNKVTQL